jgi:hypothetical protein
VAGTSRRLGSRPPAGPGGAARRRGGDPKLTEVWEPVPKVVTPGATDAAPPSDAIVLFDGTNLDQWVSSRDKGPAKWIVADGVLTVDKKTGNIETKRSFKNYQLHIEWRIPTAITGEGQGRGNSGLFLASTGTWRRRLRAADHGLVRQQDLRQRSGGEHLQAGDSAGERDAEAG